MSFILPSEGLTYGTHIHMQYRLRSYYTVSLYSHFQKIPTLEIWLTDNRDVENTFLQDYIHAKLAHSQRILPSGIWITGYFIFIMSFIFRSQPTGHTFMRRETRERPDSPALFMTLSIVEGAV